MKSVPFGPRTTRATTSTWRRAARPTFPVLKPSLRTISLRLPESMIGQLKRLAHKRDVPYQSLLKQFLAERLKKEIA